MHNDWWHNVTKPSLYQFIICLNISIGIGIGIAINMYVFELQTDTMCGMCISGVRAIQVKIQHNTTQHSTIRHINKKSLHAQNFVTDAATTLTSIHRNGSGDLNIARNRCVLKRQHSLGCKMSMQKICVRNSIWSFCTFAGNRSNCRRVFNWLFSLSLSRSLHVKRSDDYKL